MVDSLSAKTDTLIYNPKLSELKPIFIPDPVKFEPVTAGWYILLGLFLLLILFLAYKILKRYKANAYRRSSAARLNSLRANINSYPVSRTVHQIAVILKGTAIQSYTRKKVAGLAGKEWQEFLQSSAEIKDYSFDLLSLEYMPEQKSSVTSREEIERLIDSSIYWVRKHNV